MTREDVLAYAKEKYGTSPDYPWLEYPDYAVLRHAEDGKWYGLMMNVPRERLGLPGSGETDILDLKAEPARVDSLRGAEGFLPAYHMNKEHWISVLLDKAPEDQVFDLIDRSFALTETGSRGGRKEPRA